MSNEPRVTIYSYVKDLINVITNNIDEKLLLQNEELKELNKSINDLVLQLEKNKNTLNSIKIDNKKIQSEFKTLENEVNKISLEIRDIRTRTNTVVWIGQLLSKIPIKWTAVIGILTMLIVHFLQYIR